MSDFEDNGLISMKDIQTDRVVGQSWVRLTHLPTGVSAECRETPSMHKNTQIALKKLEMDAVRIMCKNIGEKARKEAFAKGHPVCYEEYGIPVYEYPDGRIIPMNKV